MMRSKLTWVSTTHSSLALLVNFRLQRPSPYWRWVIQFPCIKVSFRFATGCAVRFPFSGLAGCFPDRNQTHRLLQQPFQRPPKPNQLEHRIHKTGQRTVVLHVGWFVMQRMLPLRLNQTGHLDECGQPTELGRMVPIMHFIAKGRQQQRQEYREITKTD